jgi:hypothetical protein
MNVTCRHDQPDSASRSAISCQLEVGFTTENYIKSVAGDSRISHGLTGYFISD